MMLWYQNIPFFSIMLCMFSAILSAVVSGRVARYWCVTLCGVITAMSLVLLYNVNAAGQSFTYVMGHFPAPWGNEIRSGVLEALLCVFFAFVMLLSILGGMKHIKEDLDPSKVNLYCVMADLLLGSLLALTYTNDIFTAYVFVEISTISACGLLMIREIGRTTLASIRYMIMSLLGSGLLLIGIVLLYNLTGHLLMVNMQRAIAQIVRENVYTVPMLILVTLTTIGLAIKSGLFPFHFWMPDTYGYATPASSAILSGLVSKGYILLAIKIFYRVIGIENIAVSHILDVLFVFGLCGIIFGSISAIRQNDIRRMVAFSSAAQIGYIYMGLGLGNTAGMVAAIFHILTHMITKPLLFISAAALRDVSGGNSTFSSLQGSGRRNRVAGVAFTVGALSMVGVPTLSGFVSKMLFGLASMSTPSRTLPTLIVLAVSTVLNAVYYVRTVIRIYRPGGADTLCVHTKDQLGFTAVMILFIALNLLLGLFSDRIVPLIESGLNMFA